jgi:hypothetical protein
MQKQKVITVVVRNETGDKNFVEHNFPMLDKELAFGYKVVNVHQTVDTNGKWVYTTLTFILQL